MVTLETFFGKNFRAMLKPAFFWALPISIISLLLLFAGIIIGIILAVKGGTEGAINIMPFIGGILFSIILTNIIYALFLYLGLRNIAKKLPMEKYDSRVTFCTYISIYVILINTIVVSLIGQKFTFSGFGIVPLIIMLVIPAIYKPKTIV